MNLVEITSVDRALPQPDQGYHWHIDTPRDPCGHEGAAVDVSGWVIGPTPASVRAVEVRHRGVLLRSIPLTVSRPGVRAIHANAAEECGFWALVEVLGLEPTFELALLAELADGRRLTLGVIYGRRRPLPVPYDVRLNPVMVTSLGRTGTTWLMHLLSHHLEIVVYDRYPYEISAARYWLHAMTVLAAPANHGQSSTAWDFTNDRWKVGHNPFFTAPLTDRRELFEWFGRRYPQLVATLCLQSIDEFYEVVGRLRGSRGASHFAEKFFPDHVPDVAWDLYPGAREVVLVRDFRDVLCSIFSFNRKRGTEEFGRAEVSSDEEYVARFARDAGRLAEHWSTRSGRAHLVRYEDLVTSPERTLVSLLEYLGVDHRSATVEQLLAAATDAAARFGEHRTTSSPAASIGRWRRDLERSLHEICEEALSSALIEFGYVEEKRKSPLH